MGWPENGGSHLHQRAFATCRCRPGIGFAHLWRAATDCVSELLDEILLGLSEFVDAAAHDGGIDQRLRRHAWAAGRHDLVLEVFGVTLVKDGLDVIAVINWELLALRQHPTHEILRRLQVAVR